MNGLITIYKHDSLNFISIHSNVDLIKKKDHYDIDIIINNESLDFLESSYNEFIDNLYKLLDCSINNYDKMERMRKNYTNLVVDNIDIINSKDPNKRKIAYDSFKYKDELSKLLIIV